MKLDRGGLTMLGRFPAARLSLAVMVLATTSLSAQDNPLTRIAPPSNVTVVAGAGSVQVSWTPIAIRGMTYRVLRSPDAVNLGLDLTAPITVASFLDAKVIVGATYFYQVIAVYSDGTTGAAAPVGVTLAGAPIVRTALTTSTPTLAPATA